MSDYFSKAVRLFFILGFCVAMLSLPRFYKTQCEPFILKRTYVEIDFNPSWESSLSKEQQEQICSILDQKFYYLSRGRQSFVFESEDGKYVVKIPFFDFCKMTNGNRINWQIKQAFGIPVRSVTTFKETVNSIFSSYKIAFDHLKNETEIVWAHLNPKADFLQPFWVQEKRGFWHKIDPSLSTFIIQKKAKPFLKELKHAAKQHPAYFQHLIQSFARLQEAIGSKGCANLDIKVGSNFGVYDNKIILMDAGMLKDSAAHQKELFTAKLKGWIQRHIPIKIDQSDTV